MAEITQEQSLAEIEELLAVVLTAETLAPELLDDQPFVDALSAALDHPCAAHQIEVGELHAELAEIHRDRGDPVEAIAAWEAAIAAGLRSRPHPRAHIGRVLLESDRDAEAEKLYTQLLDDHPDDAWLCWVAGAAYDEVLDDLDAALRWVDRGIEIALATSDRDDALFELLDSRADLLSERGLDVADDDLGARAAAFVRQADPPPDVPDLGDDVGRPESCSHCGWRSDDDPTPRILLAELRQLRAALRRRGHVPGRPVPTTSTKVGRNEPCPCSSGQKYKHCHGR